MRNQLERPADAPRCTADLSRLAPGRKWPEANRLSVLNLGRPVADRFVVRMSRDLKFFDRPKNIGGNWK